MGQMNVIECPIKGLYVIEPKVFGDERGYFFESYHEDQMIAAGLDMRFVQDNESMSSKGVLRGLHFQKHYPQGKLVRVIQGRVYDVVVDLREGSATFGKHFGIELSAENHRQLYIPPGFAHGYLTLSDRAVFLYKVSEYYHPEDEGGILWCDPDIGIEWPEVIVDKRSDVGFCFEDGSSLNINIRDRHWPLIRQLFNTKTE